MRQPSPIGAVKGAPRGKRSDPLTAPKAVACLQQDGAVAVRGGLPADAEEGPALFEVSMSQILPHDTRKAQNIME